MNQMTQSRRAQLLAVASIAILALALGGVNRTWVQPRRQASACQSNLRQIGLAMANYQIDHNERFPVAAQWMDNLSPYLPAKQVLRCPARRDLNFGYAMNPRLSELHNAQVENPAEMAMVFDSDVNRRNAVDWNTAVTRPFRHPGRRNSGIMVLCADGGIHSYMSHDNFTQGILVP